MTIDSSMSFVKNRKATENENKYAFVEVLPKTKTGKRSFPLNDAALDAVNQLLELNNKHEFLLSHSCGNLTEPRNLARTLKCILKKAGISDCGIHVLRHTYASALLRRGEDVKIISTLLGHASVEITQDTYIHLIDEQTSSAATGINFTKTTTTTNNTSHCDTICYIQKQPAYAAVMQFEKPSREELNEQLETEANRLGVSALLSEATRTKILDKAVQHTSNLLARGTALEKVITPELRKIKKIIDATIAKDTGNWLTSEGIDTVLQEIDDCINDVFLGSFRWSEHDDDRVIGEELQQVESTLIRDIAPDPIFASVAGSGADKTLLAAITEMLNADQSKRVKKCIFALKNHCDNKGIISALQGANENVSPTKLMLDFNGTASEKLHLTEYFVKRLEQMQVYIEEVFNKVDSDGRTFGEKYWIRSTGSDPHKDGEHALFFVNKQNQDGHEADPRKRAGEIARVYKAHDLKPDAAVVGKEGMFNETNAFIRREFAQKSRELRLNLNGNLDALATMAITTGTHTEELVIKKGRMNPDEAKLYFFRGGILKALTDAMAVIDLHGDNIMPTESGPMIIDAEINFFHYGEGSSLTEAFGTEYIGDRRPVSRFEITGVGAGGTDISSAAAFNNIESAYRQMYEQGRTFMVERIRSKQEAFCLTFGGALHCKSFLKGCVLYKIILPATNSLH